MRPRPRQNKFRRFRVRAARGTDLDALIALEQRVFDTDRLSRASLRRLLSSPSARVIVAEGGSRLAGAAVVLFRARATVARLYSIAVKPRLSGEGMAGALVEAGEGAAR